MTTTPMTDRQADYLASLRDLAAIRITGRYADSSGMGMVPAILALRALDNVASPATTTEASAAIDTLQGSDESRVSRDEVRHLKASAKADAALWEAMHEMRRDLAATGPAERHHRIDDLRVFAHHHGLL